MYVFNIEKLPEETRKRIEEKGFKDVWRDIPPQEILEASIGRSMIKIIKTESNGTSGPAVLIESTYTISNKADHALDDLFNTLAKTRLQKKMKLPLARGGAQRFWRGQSRNSGGQYEDTSSVGILE